jgi:cation transport ATPase
LYVVGAVSIPPGSLRHEIQTLPLWFPIVAGFQRRQVAKWAALPCLVFWLAIMVFIWLFLLGWARIVSGRFSTTEIAMTLVVGAASIIGLWAAVREQTTVRPLSAVGWFVGFGVLQVGAFWLSLFPYIARR